MKNQEQQSVKQKIKTADKDQKTNTKKPKNVSTDNPWGKIFDSFAKETGGGAFSSKICDSCYCSITSHKDHSLYNIVNDMISKLSHNIKHSFEENMEHVGEILKCKTASDLIDFQKKTFEVNYKNSTKTYSDLFQNMQHLTTKGLKTAPSCECFCHKPL